MFCTDIPAPFLLIFSSTVPNLLYYSHVPAALISLFVGMFVFLKNRESLASKLLLSTAIVFFLWSFFDLVLWTNINSQLIMFVWSFVNLLEMMVSVFTLYFAYAFIEKKDISFRIKVVFAALILAFIVLIPSGFNLGGFDLVNCEAEQGSLLYYFYILEGFFSLFLIGYLIKKIFQAKGDQRKQVGYFSLGVILFLASFSGANIVGSITEKWEILQYGLFGMPVFMGFLAYLIVRYKAFNIKLFATNALVFTLIILIGSQFFFVRNPVNVILTGVTFLLVIIFGTVLIRTVGEEIKRKEELQEITNKLAIANDQLRKLDEAKSEFISIASHQLRTPLTAIKGFISMLLEGSYGKLTKRHKDVVNKVYSSNERLIRLVEDLLNLSRIESGRMEYDFKKVDLKEVCQEIYDTFVIRAKESKLDFKLKFSEKELPLATTDRAKVMEVISNLVDNAIKYTLKGKVELSVGESGESGFLEVRVKDSGIGIPQEELPYLFAKFSRGKDISRLNTGGTGLGLHVGKRMIESLHGRISVHSDGEGKGSTFTVTVPVEMAE